MLTFTIKNNFQKQLLSHQSSRSMGSRPCRNFLQALTWCLLPRRGNSSSKREILFIINVVASSVTEQDIPNSYTVIGFLCWEEGTILPALDYLPCQRENSDFLYDNPFLTKLLWLEGWGLIDQLMRALARVAKEVKFRFQIFTSAWARKQKELNYLRILSQSKFNFLYKMQN